jgi:polysaccharide deacetylase family protein (PEP-CTERM system associated)
MASPPDILTIDVEEWFHGHNYLGQVPPESWDDQVCRIEGNTELCLDLLAAHGVAATFFVLGWTAERYPGLVRRIAESGHEIACHSHVHPEVFALDETAFRADLERALAALSAAGATEVAGYRAPSFSLTPPVHHYLHILQDYGLTYDASLFPVHHPRYGQPDAPRAPFLLGGAAAQAAGPDRDPLLVLPMTTARLLGVNVGFAGGGYLRVLPRALYRLLRSVAQRQGQAVVTYLHPWELDDWRPGDVGQSRLQRWRSQGGQRSVRAKLTSILREGDFRTMGEYASRLRESGRLPVRSLPLC